MFIARDHELIESPFMGDRNISLLKELDVFISTVDL